MVRPGVGVDVDALKRTTSPGPGLVGEKTKSASGSGGPATVMLLVARPVRPMVSSATADTTKAPGVRNTCVALGTEVVVVLPSPKFQV